MSHYVAAVFSKTPEEVAEVMEPYNEVVGAASPYSEFYADEEYDYDETAKQKGHWFNPNARWDWWEIGGRWSKLLRLRNGKPGQVSIRNKDFSCRLEASTDGLCDQALAADCDFSMDQKRYDEAVRFWEVIVEEQPLREGEEIFSHLNGKYFLERYRDKEAYALERGKSLPFAFVASDGSWHEAGKMGWFGIDDATAESREKYRQEWESELQKGIEQGLTLTMVDCHI